MQADLYKKAIKVLNEYIRRTDNPDMLGSHYIFNGVGFYIDANDVDSDGRVLVDDTPYFQIKLGGLETTFADYGIGIDYKNMDLYLQQDINKFLDTAMEMVKGVEQEVCNNQFALLDKVVELTKTVEVENLEQRTKAKILDDLINRFETVSLGKPLVESRY